MTTILQALQALSSVCDGAASEDGQGFNGVDTGFGKSLASKTFLNEKQEVAALKMLRKYSKQLLGFGIVYKDLAVTEKTITINYNDKAYCVYFNGFIPTDEDRTAMKSVYGKWYPEKNNAWAFPYNDNSIIVIEQLANKYSVVA